MNFDKHDLYELCVQSPTHLAPLLRAVHGRNPATLGEDFAGTAALSYEWVKRDRARAVAVDMDTEALGKHPDHPRVSKVVSDVRTVPDACDVLFVGNFSIGYLHTPARTRRVPPPRPRPPQPRRRVRLRHLRR